jgi:hypothetical protein
MVIAFTGFSSYIYLMVPEIVYVPSAFKHDVTKADIVRAFETFIYEDMIEDFDNKHLLLGFNIHGNLIEVMYNRIGADAIKVFHAMPCRRAFRELLDDIGEIYGEIYRHDR